MDEGFHTAHEVASAWLVGYMVQAFEQRLEGIPTFALVIARQLEQALLRELGAGIQLVDYHWLRERLHDFSRHAVLVHDWVGMLHDEAIERVVRRLCE